MPGLSGWGDVSSLDISIPQQSNKPILAHVFASYLSGEMAFSGMQAEVLSAYRALHRAGQTHEAICRFVHRELDRGAAQATPCENVYRFNAINDELAHWVARTCVDTAAEYPLKKRARG